MKNHPWTKRQLRLETLEDRLAPAAGLASVTSLSNAHLRLHFDVPMARAATNPANYAIPGLTVEKATFRANRRDIVLTTSPQDDIDYSVTARNLVARNGSPLSGPLTRSFEGTPDPSLFRITPLTSTSMLLKFNTLLNPSQARLRTTYAIDGLTVTRARLLRNGTDVVLTTTPQEAAPYSIDLVNLRTKVGNLPVGPGEFDTFFGYPGDQTPPRVTGATSTGNTRILVSFSEPMTDAALNPASYRINQTTFNPEAGALRVLGGRAGEEASAPQFLDADRKLVELTTSPQNELSYTLTAFNLTDLAGNPFAPPTVVAGQRVDPAQATFTGTPPSGDELVDSDGDGLTDNDEMRGWLVVVTPSNYVTQQRWVTSDPFSVDTDGEGFPDNVEAQLRLDPRDADSDDDLLTDWQEYTEIFSDHLKGDSDGDGVDDGTEFLGVKSSPVFADTDGDQIPDGLEIPLGGPRNILVANLPRPEISVGGVNLQLDVRFTESNNRESRDLSTESFRTSLANATTTTKTYQHTANVEFGIAAGIRGGFEQGAGVFVISGDTHLTAGYTYNYTDETANESRGEYEKSLQAEREVSQGFTVERTLVGAAMQVAVNLHNLSDLAYRVKNLQVTALIQDPLDHSRLTPVATLTPDFEPEEGFTLGPLVADRGPIICSSDTIIPSLVESLMANSTGLIFRISNYDVVNEDGRNFAFTSQDVVERTGAVLIDFGGANQLLAQVNGESFDQTNPPPQVEAYRVTVTTGRPIADNNGDGRIDTGPARELFDSHGTSLGIDANGDGQITDADDTFVPDRRVTFDPKGIMVGINFHQALASIGLVRYDESATPTANLSQEQILNSYSTIKVGNLERIYRIREIANDAVNQRYWELISKLGIVQDADLDHVILTTASPISLNFVQDLDGDGLPADVEYFLRTSDSPEIPDDFLSGKVPAFTSPDGDWVMFNSGDPLNVATGDPVQVSASGGGLTAGVTYFIRRDAIGLNPSYYFYTSRAAAVAGGDAGLVDLTNDLIHAAVAPRSAPRGFDTDGDRLDDRFEALIGWQVVTPQRTYQVYSSPNRADSNFDSPKPGVDSDGDGVFDRLEYDGSDLAAAPAGWDDPNNNGLRDPGEVFQLAMGDLVLDPIRKDTDGDGIDDATEVIGYRITPITGGTRVVISNPITPFTDSDTFSDGLERLLGLDPTDPADTDEDGDGLPDSVETTSRAIGRSGLALDIASGGVPTETRPDDDVVLLPVFFGNTTRVRVTASGGGLMADTDYFLHLLGSPTPDSSVYSFHTSSDDAVAGQGPVDLTSNITATVARVVIRTGVESVSSEPYGQGMVTPRTVTSRTDAVDSDGDGLTDFEEYFLRTDPMSKDTDGDAIPDRVEFLGYALGHQVGGQNLGIIKTDPLDADTDNDMLSDGTEAELTDADFDGNPEPLDERSLWVVRVRNAEPYRAFSNPLLADADFDGIVDGIERPRGTDPNNGNTDADQRDDGVEIIGGTNPLAEDFRVTVFFNRLTITARGDPHFFGDVGELGEIAFDLGVRQPGTGVAGLSTDLTHVVTEQVLLSSPFNYQKAFDIRDVEPYLPVGTGSLQNDNDLPGAFGRKPGIAFNNGDSLNLVRYVPVAERSFTFGMTSDQSFAVEALVGDWDGLNQLTYVYLGGIDGVQGSRATSGGTGGQQSLRPVFLGTELLAGTSPFIDVSITFTATDNLYGGYPTATPNPADVPAIAGTLYFTIFVG